jgi:glycosyltransferase involved in cell wall biosynthesis
VIRVAALIATESLSGPGRQLAALGGPLRAQGIDLHVLVLVRNTAAVPPYARHLESAGVAHSMVPDRGPLDGAIVRAVRNRLRDLGAAVLQTHGYKASAAGWVLRRSQAGPPWIGFFHGSTDKGIRDRFYQAVERRMLRGADRIVVVAGSQRELFTGLPVEVMPNAVLPVSAARTDPEAHASLAVGERPLIGVIGRLSREKGVDIFLNACAALRSRGIRFRAVIVGEGPEAPTLREQCRALDLDGIVTFTGHAADVGALYPQLDLVVLPSRSEGLPNVLLEALAADRPVVATAVGAVPDVLAVPHSGVLVPPGDVRLLADGIERALADTAATESAAARAATAARFSLEQRVERHVQLYRELSVQPGELLSA